MTLIHHEPAHYFILLAPAVTFLLALSNRQTRISVIARDNCRAVLEIARNTQPMDTDPERLTCLVSQNQLLLKRYELIQAALVVLCVGLLVLGASAFHEYFSGNWSLFGSGVVVMGAGTCAIVFELLRAADTLSYEIAYAQWIAQSRGKQELQPAPSLEPFAIFGALRRRRAAAQGAQRRSGA